MDNMDNMDMSSSSGMAMTFFTSTNTPLFSTPWTPRTTAQYAGTCIFLIALSFILRLLHTIKCRVEAHWHAQNLKRRYIVTQRPRRRRRQAEKAKEGEKADDSDSSSEWDVTDISSSSTAANSKAVSEGVLTVNGVTERVRIVQSSASGHGTPPFRLSVDLVRAAYGTVLLGVSYLLMLAVMTYNVGYFMSVLAGAFVGELCFGRWATHVEEHH